MRNFYGVEPVISPAHAFQHSFTNLNSKNALVERLIWVSKSSITAIHMDLFSFVKLQVVRNRFDRKSLEIIILSSSHRFRRVRLLLLTIGIIRIVSNEKSQLKLKLKWQRTASSCAAHRPINHSIIGALQPQSACQDVLRGILYKQGEM